QGSSAQVSTTCMRTDTIRPITAALCCLVLVLCLASAEAQVRISEFMASNAGGGAGTAVLDEDGEASDWIELENLSTSPVNLLDWALTDNSGNLTKWRFPATNLPPGGFLLVFASDKDRRAAGSPLHTNFKLAAEGE